MKESREAKEERAKHNTTRVLCTQADVVAASGSAASAFGSPLKSQLRVVPDLADGAPESASKKSATFGDDEVWVFEKATKSDAEEEKSDDLEAPKKKREVVSEEEKAENKAKKAEREAKKAEREAEKAAREAERKAEKERKEKIAKDKKDLAEQKKMLKQKTAEKRESRRKMSKKHKARNADKDVMDIASLLSVEELERMVEVETEALGGMVGGDGNNTADDSSHSDEVDVSDDDL